MPDAAPSFCVVPGCSGLARRKRGHCRVHAVVREHARPNFDIRRWYRTPRWRAMRRRVQSDQVFRCAVCARVVLKLEVDHIRKHDGDPARFWDRSNLQGLCRSCHQRKTQRGE